jgi:hypothetical protein
LTLVYPPDVEDTIIELMLGIEPALGGFTTWLAEGHGHDFATASVRERVRGRVMRALLAVVVPRARVPAILEEVRTKAAIVNIAYWIEPVEAFGLLTPVETAAHPAAA